MKIFLFCMKNALVRKIKECARKLFLFNIINIEKLTSFMFISKNHACLKCVQLQKSIGVTLKKRALMRKLEKK